jgi:hypothetical protein
MRRKARKLNIGVTLIEVMVASLAVLVVAIGAMNFQYYCALDARRADVKVTAGRLGLLLLEGWNLASGSNTYYPLGPLNRPEFTIIDPEDNDGVDGFSDELGRFIVKVNSIGVEYHVTLSYSDPAAGPRKLNASIAWHSNSEETEFSPRNKVSLTTYLFY